MSEFELTPIRCVNGTWEGVVTRSTGEDAPRITVTHRERPLDGVVLSPDPARPDQWHLRIAVPPEALNDGVQTFLVQETTGARQIGAFSIAMGDALEGDIRAEVELLRAELDMLKRAFRRHCVETA